MDLFILGLAEKPLKGAMLGPTFICLLAHQFQKVMKNRRFTFFFVQTKKGDHFWVGHRMQAFAFSDQQLAELRKTTLAQIICANTDLDQIQPRPFQSADQFEFIFGVNLATILRILSNFPIPCNSTLMDGPNWNEAWKDAEPKIQMPFSMKTVQKAVELGLERMLEKRKRESGNFAKSAWMEWGFGGLKRI